MRYKFDTKESNVKVKNKLYYVWADKLYDSGLTYRLDELMSDLNVSINWVNMVLYAEIDSVRYTKKYLLKKYESINRNVPNNFSTICFNKQQIIDFFKTNAVYTRQTQIVDAAEHLNVPQEEFQGYMREYSDTHKSLPDCFYKNVPTETFNKWLSEKYNKSFYALKYRQRNLYVHEPVEPLNIFDPAYQLIVANNNTKSNQEVLYRDMICDGAIKVTLGAKKTFFMLKKENGDIKTPYVVPCQTPLTIKKEKKRVDE